MRWSACARRAGCSRRCAPRGFASCRCRSRVGFRRWRMRRRSAIWCGCSAPSGPIWCTRICRSAAFWRDWRRGSRGCLAIAYTCHGFLFNQDGSWLRRADGLAMEWLGGRVTDDVLDGLQPSEAAMRVGCTSFATPSPSATAETRQCFVPIQRRVPPDPRRAGRRGRTGWWLLAVSRLVRTRAIRNWPLRCARCRRRICGSSASGSTSDRGD